MATKTYYFKDSRAESLILTVSATELGAGSSALTVNPGSPTVLVR
jgi:hypothetical protein